MTFPRTILFAKDEVSLIDEAFQKFCSLRKAAMRVIDTTPCGTNCRSLLGKYGILLLPCIYIV